MANFLKTFMHDESGASAAEYALIIAIVGVGLGAAAMVLGANVKKSIDNASSHVAACSSASTLTTVPTKSTGTEC